MSIRPIVLTALALGLGACGSPTENVVSDLDLMKQATASYADIDAALAAGFVPLSECVASPDGAMGFHYGHPPRMDDATIDPEAPEVLLYEPTAGGGYRLVGVEFMMHQDVWAGAGNTGNPSVAGQSFSPPNPAHPDENVRPFYTLHAWVWQDNPSGMFAPFNPSVSCN